MKAGALAFCTVMTEMTWDRIGNDPNYSGAIDAFKNKYPMPYKASAKDYKKPMPRERMVFWAPGSPIYNSDVYHHSEYVRREWGRFFDVVEILPAHLDLQDLVVLQKI